MQAFLFDIRKHRGGFTILPASKMQLVPAPVARINSGEHCGFVIKLLSAISKFIVLIVFTWLLHCTCLISRMSLKSCPRHHIST